MDCKFLFSFSVFPDAFDKIMNKRKMEKHYSIYYKYVLNERKKKTKKKIYEIKRRLRSCEK